MPQANSRPVRRGQRGPGARPDQAVLQQRDGFKLAGKQQHRPPDALVGHQQVGALPQHQVGQALGLQGLEQSFQLGQRFHGGKAVRRAADLKGGVAAHGLPHGHGNPQGLGGLVEGGVTKLHNVSSQLRASKVEV